MEGGNFYVFVAWLFMALFVFVLLLTMWWIVLPALLVALLVWVVWRLVAH
jgi:hypothetical protein